MSSHADILDESDHLGRPFWGSMALHLGMALAIIGSGQLGLLEILAPQDRKAPPVRTAHLKTSRMKARSSHAAIR